jgi:hypothetical protein
MDNFEEWLDADPVRTRKWFNIMGSMLCYNPGKPNVVQQDIRCATTLIKLFEPEQFILYLGELPPDACWAPRELCILSHYLSTFTRRTFLVTDSTFGEVHWIAKHYVDLDPWMVHFQGYLDRMYTPRKPIRSESAVAAVRLSEEDARPIEMGFEW